MAVELIVNPMIGAQLRAVEDSDGDVVPYLVFEIIDMNGGPSIMLRVDSPEQGMENAKAFGIHAQALRVAQNEGFEAAAAFLDSRFGHGSDIETIESEALDVQAWNSTPLTSAPDDIRQIEEGEGNGN